MNKEKKSKKTIYGWEVLLPLGIILILLGIAMLIRIVFSVSFWSLWPFLLIVIGIAFVFLCIHINHQSKFLFMGSFLILCGILMLVISSGFTDYNLKQFWPLFALFLGVALLLTGKYKKKRWGTFQFIIPAISLIILSFFFALFSFDIIKESLSEIVSIFWPILFVLAGLFMVVVFYEKQNIQLRLGSKQGQDKVENPGSDKKTFVAPNYETKSVNQADMETNTKKMRKPKK